MGWGSSNVSRFDIGPLLQDQMSLAKLTSAYNLLIIAARGLGCETNLLEIMDFESSDVLLTGFGCLSTGHNLDQFSDVLGPILSLQDDLPLT